MTQESSKYDPNIRVELDKQDWEKIFPRVLKYAIARSRKYYWLGGDVVEPQELIHEAISLAWGIGKNKTYRNWNKEKYPQLEDFLISIIESITSHKADHSMRIKKESLFSEDGTENFELSVSSKRMVSKDYLNSPEEKMIQSESLEYLKDKLKSIAEEDEEAGLVILCFEEEISLPREIANATGYDVTKVHNILRRIRTKLKEFKSSPRRDILKNGGEK